MQKSKLSKKISINIHFETATPLETPRLMEMLVGTTQERFQDEDIHPLLTIADFIVRFPTIHPYLVRIGRLVKHGKGRGGLLFTILIHRLRRLNKRKKIHWAGADFNECRLRNLLY
jgi:hypothetical protein